ncbi:RagB/SusD family nutrient uptake outer membrane protein [Sinomicrobium pectinilyticum]|uniref:RagB/SusD family nutrient uptake outer membrane protein n=1 Tax=Sinomicrobium pectinilyticum TaxID=1084421 RepID=A0A3N0EIM7_SINP1|nr:RagB/SusD family nutrient uptake outer membrane protein [Sinomicrobium pectinilyticum]RNL87740.1 RagB/SusD family nutrient uptake outer membrane protein [Sinomicrobium pectinilyticum]
MKKINSYYVNRIYGAIIFLVLCIFLSCEDFVEINPPSDELISETVFVNDENAIAAIRGTYYELKNGFGRGNSTSLTVLGAINADDLDYLSTNVDFLGFYDALLIPENSWIDNNWKSLYQVIYQTNSILEGLQGSTGITPDVKELLEGEAKCIRAFCYFYLVNLWGEVPLIISTDYEKNRLASRATISQIYELILSDLKEAQELLPEDYAHAEEERVRVTKSAATALLARTYLYLEDWAQAEEQASKVIENSNYMLMEDLNGVFLKNSMEAIWQIKPINVGHTDEGNLFILTSTPSMAVSHYLINTFESGDKRKSSWIGSFSNEIGAWNYPFKYKVKQESDPDNATEYSMVFRLAEQYLIRAEARVQQGNTTGAQKDINIIRNRSGLKNTTAITQEELLDAIIHERQVELFTEWGHRWLDLKRTNRSGEVFGPIKSGWEVTDVLWPIPQPEIDNNPNLIQNTGY